LNVPFLGQIPIDPKICEEADNGKSFITGNTDSAKAFKEIVKNVEAFLEAKKAKQNSTKKESK